MKQLKFLREKDSRSEYANRKDQTVEYVFGSVWLPELKEKAFRETTENTTTDHSILKKASSMYKKYIPDACNIVPDNNLDTCDDNAIILLDHCYETQNECGRNRITAVLREG